MSGRSAASLVLALALTLAPHTAVADGPSTPPPAVSAVVDRAVATLAASTSATERRRAVRTLVGSFTDVRAEPALVAALAHDPSVSVRLAVVRALSRAGAGCDAFRWASTVDESRRVRRAARRALDRCPIRDTGLGELLRPL